MARFLFCWELGQGLGHLVRYRGLVEKLVENGHEVFYLARDPDRVRRVNPQAEIHVEQIQVEFLPPEKQIRQPRAASPATLLLNCGFSSADRLAARARNWIERIESIKPDYIISDHSPTAVFANRFLNYPIVIAGNGFTAPPAENPFRLFQYWRFEPTAQSRAFETQLTGTLNDAVALIRNGATRFAHASELFEGTQRWLMTFPELDCYGERPGACYLGTFPQTDFGENFNWPSSPGPKIFAYLNKLQGLEVFADWSAQHELSLCLCGTEFPQELLDRFNPNRIYLADRPAKLSIAFEQADVAINNGPANTMANLVLAGIPQLAFPKSVENLMEARRIELLGCGVTAIDDNEAALARKMRALLENPAYRSAAAQLKEKYREQNTTAATNLMYDKLTLR